MSARKLAILGIALAGALAITGCTINLGTSGDDRHGMMSKDNESGYSSQDIMFAQMMIPHHQQAVDLGTLAESRASNTQVKTIAAQIKSEQAPEIEQMKSWLDAGNSGMDMGHDMGMDGMLSSEEMTVLENSTGAEFDRLYVAGMISHHEGAIQMAQMVLNSSSTEIRALGEAIIESQTKQVSYLKGLLTKLG
jgi:uncharacterized protein (DUF305 family)